MFARRAFLALCASLVLASPVLAEAPIKTIAANSTYKDHSIEVSTKGANISTADFAKVIMDGNNYPMTAEYSGVKALLDCKTLEKRADGSVVVYQRTGGLWPVASRHYVIVLKPTVLNDTVAEVRWELVEHSKKGDTFEGPYAAALNTHKDAVYTPYNRGGWKYDKSAGTIKYWVATDPGGSLPAFMQTQGAMMAFPKELLKVKWGVKAD